MKNKKLLFAIIAGVLAAVIVATVVIVVVVLNKDGDVYDNEEDALVFSTLELDEVFNPFFSTSATDSNVVGMTQISMLSNTANGQVAYGENEGVVTLDYDEVSNNGVKDVDLTTTYYFVLKNNVKFSDGTPLTMKDVLFNLYVYLDPLYTGSATMYSTDIVGLKEYRTQERDENEQEGFREQFELKARNRISDLTRVADDINDDYAPTSAEDFREHLVPYAKDNSNANIVADFDKAVELFRKELETDWSNSLNSYQDTKFKKKGDDVTVYTPFTTDVEMFLYNEGFIRWNREEGKLEDDITNNNQTHLIKAWADDADKGKERAIQTVFDAKIPGAISEVVNYWVTATDLFNYITNAEIEKYFSSQDGREVDSISGIKFANREVAVTVNGVTYPAMGTDRANYNEDGSPKQGFNEVLSITINNVDPKAKWNFAFAVAPMHYYSDKAHCDAFDYERNFGVEFSSQTFMNEVLNSPDKVGLPMGAGPYAASKSAGGINTKDDMNVVSSSQFFDANTVYYERNPHYILGAAKIKKVRFTVVSSNGMLNALYNNEIDFAEPSAKPELIDEIDGKGFESKSVTTSGYGYIGVNAGKVPSINVRQAIMHTINTQLCVDYYNTTASAIYRPMSKASFIYDYIDEPTPYYPYIGGAIPKVLEEDGEPIVNPAYYNYVNYVHDSGETTYANRECTVAYTGSGDEYFNETQQLRFIEWLVTENANIIESEYETNYNFAKNSNGIYTTNVGATATRTLKYTFTVAGEETDHPAWSAMIESSNILNKCGFEINVKTDANALTKLATGSLTVWAAAWGSTIDPDMYQVYHRDSSASSTWNWGYREIKQNNGGRYNFENDVIDELSELIDSGREFNEESIRSQIYNDALDLVMKLAVELPTYQRDDLFAYNQNKIDISTLYQSPTPFKGLTSDIHSVSLVTER